MDFEFMKDLMGDSYKDGITLDEVKTFMSGKKFADLSTGNYVDKNKYTNEVTSLQGQLTDAQTQLKNKMTDDEKIVQAQKYFAVVELHTVRVIVIPLAFAFSTISIISPMISAVGSLQALVTVTF